MGAGVGGGGSSMSRIEPEGDGDDDDDDDDIALVLLRRVQLNCTKSLATDAGVEEEQQRRGVIFGGELFVRRFPSWGREGQELCSVRMTDRQPYCKRWM